MSHILWLHMTSPRKVTPWLMFEHLITTSHCKWVYSLHNSVSNYPHSWSSAKGPTYLSMWPVYEQQDDAHEHCIFTREMVSAFLTFLPVLYWWHRCQAHLCKGNELTPCASEWAMHSFPNFLHTSRAPLNERVGASSLLSLSVLFPVFLSVGGIGVEKFFSNFLL